MIEETWRDVLGFEKFFRVSNFGRIFSKRTNRVLKTHIAKTGYEIFSTRLGGRDSVAICFRVHRLVALAFIERPDGVVEVNHRDGVKTNNRVENLEWVTASRNTIHSLEMGLGVRPRLLRDGFSNSKHAKLSAQDVLDIRGQYVPRDREVGARALSRKYKVHHSLIEDIVHLKKHQP